MIKRPVVFPLLACVFFIVALSFPFQALFLYGEGFSFASFVQALSKVSILNLFVIGILLLNVPLLLKVHSALIVTLPLAGIIVIWNNYVVGRVGLDVTFLTTVVASLGFLILSASVLLPAGLDVLTDPSKRWWQQSMRRQVIMPVKVKCCGLPDYQISTYDVSESGAFLTGFDPFGENDLYLEEGDIIDLNLKLSTLLNVKCSARVVRRSAGEGRYPTGVGVEFLGLPKGDRLTIGRQIS